MNRNEFGGSFSGPLPLPNFGEGGPVIVKNKGFFFFNYEGFRLVQQVAASATTLLPQARNGTFTFVNSAGQQSTVNVLTGANFTTPLTDLQGGVLNVDPIIQSRILNNLPTTANGITAGINYLQGINFQRNDRLEKNAITTRFDIDFNDRNTFNAVYRRNDLQDPRSELASGFSTESFVTQSGPTNFFAAAYRTTPTSKFSNEIRGGFQISKPFFFESNVPQDFLIGGLPVTNPEGSFRNQGRNTDYRNIQDNAVYTTGNHSFRFGAQAEAYKIETIGATSTATYTLANSANPNIPGLTASQICGTTTCINTTDLERANTLRYFLGGIIGSGSRTANLRSLEEGFDFNASREFVNYKIYSGYGSDQWRVRPNFTLNLGLRYEYYTPLVTPNPLFLEPVINGDDLAGSIINPNGVLNVVGGNAGNKGQFTNPDRNNFAPSISFAYSPQFDKGLFSGLLGGNTTIRGGFRINYVNDEYVKSPFTLLAANRGLGAVSIRATDENGLTTVRSSLTPRAGFVPLPRFTTLPTLPTLPLTYEQYNINSGFVSQLFGIDPNLQLGKVYEWNIGIQREIGFKSVFEIRYVGNMSNDLIRTTDFNEVDIRNNGFFDDFRRAQSNLAATDAERTRRINTCVAGGQTVAACTTQTNTALPRTAAFNAAVPGTVALPVFNQLQGGGTALLANANNLTFISRGQVGSLAQTLITTRQRGSVVFQANPNIFLSEIVTNAGKQRYNALQAEIRRRFSDGLSYQVNYTFQKTLTDIPDDSQNRQGELQDSGKPGS
ncbi:MAG: hypothetical protein WKF71_09340 [Pyrinomonadaceae bacterium]